VMLFGVVLWFVYGLFIHSSAVIIANGITAGLIVMLLNYKIKFSKK